MNSSELDQLLMRLVRDQSPFRGVVYRVTSPEYSSQEELLSGKGASDWGGRWNPVGIAAVYSALDESTALAESGSRSVSVVFPVRARARSLIVTPMEVTFDRVAHLSPQSSKGVDPKLISMLFMADYRSCPILPCPSQELGGKLAIAGIQALRVPSIARPDGECLVIFRENVSQTAFSMPPDRIG